MAVQVELTVTTGRTHLPVVRVSRFTGVVMAVVAVSGDVTPPPSVTVTDAGNGLFTVAGVTTVDNGDGTFTITGATVTDAGNGLFTLTA